MIPKFKVWDKDEQYFITDATIVLNQNGNVEGLEYYHSKLQHSVYNDISYYELMQFTGLKDKNGVEIFEGDVVKVTDESWGDDFIVSNVIWFGDTEWQYPAFDLNGLYIPKDFHFEANALNTCILENEVEIIGNIFEDKELLDYDSE